MENPESKFKEFEKVIKDKIAENDLTKNESYAFYGYFYAMMDYEIISFEEYRVLREMLPLTSEDVDGFSF